MGVTYASPDDAVFEITGPDSVMPTELAQGPWNPNHLHGGAAAALFAALAESISTPGPMRIVRLTVDLPRGVPMSALRWTHRVRRAGRRVQLVDLVVLDGGTEVAFASALSMAESDGVEVSEPHELAAAPPPIPRRGGGRPWGPARGEAWAPPGFVRCFDAETIVGGHGIGVPSVTWFRLRCPVFDDRPVTPLQRLVACSDYVSGQGAYFDFGRRPAINPDVSLSILRYPASEWIGLDATYQMTTQGIGQARAFLHDETGYVATVSCSSLAT